MRKIAEKTVQVLAVALTFIVYHVHKVYNIFVFWDVFPIYKSWLINDKRTMIGFMYTIITLTALYSINLYIWLLVIQFIVRILKIAYAGRIRSGIKKA